MTLDHDKIFVVFMKNLKIQLKKQDNSTVTDFKSVMSSKYHDFLDVFFKEKTDILSSHKKHDHRIKLKKNHESKHEYASLYNLSKKKLLLIKKYLKEHLEWPSGWVEPELGRPTLGLGRVGRTLSVREGWTGSGFCPEGLIGFGFLFDGLDRTGILVRRALNSNLGPYKNLGLSDQP
jgi:hypothetical protein